MRTRSDDRGFDIGRHLLNGYHDPKVLRFMSPKTNLFTQDLVLPRGMSARAEWSEQFPRLNLAKYAAVFANRSTKEYMGMANSDFWANLSLNLSDPML